ncbi:MAG: S9 family peptidase [Flavobacteriaceae bacterium]
MKKFLFSALAVLVSSLTFSQQTITLEEIWSGAFSTEGIANLRSLNSGNAYTVLEYHDGKSQIVKYRYSDMQSEGVLLSSGDAIPRFSGYTFSDDESRVLLATKRKPIFRRSSEAVYYVYDFKTQELTKVSDSLIRVPAFSPDGSKLAYVFENNLYVFDIASKSSRQLTEDGKYGSIINGHADWVYEEEFSLVRAYEWSPEGTHLAYLKFDESLVPEFSMDVFGTELYPSQYRFKYPKAGENNAEVEVHVIDLTSGKDSPVALSQDYYIPRIQFMNHGEHLSVQTLNRHQNRLMLYKVNIKTLEVGTLLEETDEAYVDLHDNLTFLPKDDFIWTSERDGYNHIYLYSSEGKLVRQITSGEFEVTNFYGYDQKKDRIFYQSTEPSSIERAIYRISTKGKYKTRLTTRAGTHNAQFSKDFQYFIGTYSSSTTPYEFTLRDPRTGSVLSVIKDNAKLAEKLKGYDIAPKEFGTLNVGANQLNMYMIRPNDFDPSKKYPLLMFQYSGPGSQQVADQWMGSNDYWHQMLASQGYIVACVDGRGTGFKGRDFKKSTYLNLVKFETEDQIAAAKKLSELDYIDETRTGIWGWSFGGHMSTNALLKGNDVFEMAIAVAPVTSWRFYDTIYTERFLRTPEENPGGYDNESPFNYPELLKGKYLLVHGSGDDNVHVQNSMRMIEALIQANKPFDWAIYPDRNHGIYGGNTRLHLYSKMTEFIKNNL